MIGDTCSGGFGDNLARISVVDNEDLGDGNEEEGVVAVVGAGVDDVGVGGFRFGLG